MRIKLKMIWLSGISAAVVLGSLCAAQVSTPSQTGSTAPKKQQSQTQPVQSKRSTQVPRIAPGSVVPVKLTETIDAKKVKTGDEVVAKVTQDLKNQNGQVIIPQNTEIVGHVTETEARTKQQKESEVGIAFDHAVLKDGDKISLPSSIQAIIAPQNQNQNQNQNSNNNGEGPGAASSPSSGPPGSRPTGMGTGAPSQEPGSYPAAGEQPNNNAPVGSKANQPAITAQTRGIVGISNCQLSNTGSAKEASVVSSEKSNVKLKEERSCYSG